MSVCATEGEGDAAMSVFPVCPDSPLDEDRFEPRVSIEHRYRQKGSVPICS